jgi:molecular chaperone GrpE
MTGAESGVSANDTVSAESSDDTREGHGAAQPPTDPAALLAALEAAQAKSEENHELYLRARADTENARRRGQEDVAKAHKYAIESFAESLVPVFDSLEKALQDESSSTSTLREGVELTLRQLRSAFERSRLTEINPVGEKFDPHRHQAISAVAGDGTVAPNHVLAVLQKGWMISDRVLRPALVTIVQGS